MMIRVTEQGTIKHNMQSFLPLANKVFDLAKDENEMKQFVDSIQIFDGEIVSADWAKENFWLSKSTFGLNIRILMFFTKVGLMLKTANSREWRWWMNSLWFQIIVNQHEKYEIPGFIEYLFPSK